MCRWSSPLAWELAYATGAVLKSKKKKKGKTKKVPLLGGAVPMACGSPQTRDQTDATAATWAVALTALDP